MPFPRRLIVRFAGWNSGEERIGVLRLDKKGASWLPMPGRKKRCVDRKTGSGPEKGRRKGIEYARLLRS